MARQTAPAHVFADAVHSLVAESDLLETLQRLVELAVRHTETGGAGIVVLDADGVLRHAAHSGERLRKVLNLEAFLGEGPVTQCLVDGTEVHADDLRTTAQRWPAYAEAFAETGFTSVCAVPLRLEQRTVGALGVFGGGSVPRSGTDRPGCDAQTIADLAVIALLQATAPRHRLLREGIARSVGERAALEEAKGMVAQYGNLGMDEAFDRLRSCARHHRLPLSEIVQALTSGTLPLAAVLEPGRGSGRPS